MTVIFVFGSNASGRHGKGAALEARRNWGAIYGKGEGIQGRSYGIPTKNAYLRTLPLEDIGIAVERFKAYAAEHPELTFQVTPIGCGLAGYQAGQIAPMFEGYPSNCILPESFLVVLQEIQTAAHDLFESLAP